MQHSETCWWCSRHHTLLLWYHVLPSHNTLCTVRPADVPAMVPVTYTYEYANYGPSMDPWWWTYYTTSAISSKNKNCSMEEEEEPQQLYTIRPSVILSKEPVRPSSAAVLPQPSSCTVRLAGGHMRPGVLPVPAMQDSAIQCSRSHDTWYGAPCSCSSHDIMRPAGVLATTST